MDQRSSQIANVLYCPFSDGTPEQSLAAGAFRLSGLQQIGAAARQARSQKTSQVRAELLPAITAIQATGATSLRAIAAELNLREIPTPRRVGNGRRCRSRG